MLEHLPSGNQTMEFKTLRKSGLNKKILWILDCHVWFPQEILKAVVFHRGFGQTKEMLAAIPAAPVQPPGSGSRGHPALCRRPCIRFANGSCDMGDACGYCHYDEHPHFVTPNQRQRLLLNKLDALFGSLDSSN